MFKRKANRSLPKHIDYFSYHRDKTVRKMPEEDKVAIEEFYERNNIKHKGLTPYQQVIIFKRTVNYIYIVANFFDKKPWGHFPAKLGPDKGFGVVRTQAFVFYRTGELLYELDHDYQTYDTQVEDRKLLKRAYELHDQLNNDLLKEIGKHCQRFISFDRACHALLKDDDTPKSVDFIKED